MGTCLTCCKAPELERSAKYAEGPNSSITLETNQEQLQPLHVTLRTNTGDHIKPADHVPTTKPGVISEKKMFTPYSKIPPIKRQSNGESKRTSLISREFSENKANALFDHYKDSTCDCILADGVERFCEDLDVKPDAFIVLLLAWKLNAEAMCVFTRDQFVRGCQSMKVDSVKGIQSKFPDLLAEVQNKSTFKEMYKWTYKFGLDHEAGQRTLPLDMAVSLWKLVFSQQEPKTLPRWLNFLQKHQNIRGISRDTWDMFLNFVDQVGDDLSTYDDTEAWPSLLDDFVEYETDCQNQNTEMD